MHSGALTVTYTPALPNMHISRVNIGFIIAGLRAIRPSSTECAINPMKVSVSIKVLIGLILVSLVSSTVSRDDAVLWEYC